MGMMLKYSVRELNSFMRDFMDSSFYLLSRCAFRTVRTVRLLRAVIQFYYKLLYHLSLCRGCNRMFCLSVLWTVVPFSNIWNTAHLRIESHCGTCFRHGLASHGEIYLSQLGTQLYCFPRRCRHEFV